MAKEEAKPQAAQQPADTGFTMKKFAIYKMVKKTNLNPTGEKLLTVTFAPSIEKASELAREMIERDDGPRWKIVPID